MGEGINKAIDTLNEDELRDLARDYAHENRRLRLILSTLARAGVGKGALVELHFDEGDRVVGVTVCRADVDETAFSASMRDGLRELAGVFGGEFLEESAYVTGVTAEVDEEIPR